MLERETAMKRRITNLSLISFGIATVWIFASLVLHAGEADCYPCRIAICQTSSDCPSSCACALKRNTSWGQCVEIHP